MPLLNQSFWRIWKLNARIKLYVGHPKNKIYVLPPSIDQLRGHRLPEVRGKGEEGTLRRDGTTGKHSWVTFPLLLLNTINKRGLTLELIIQKDYHTTSRVSLIRCCTHCSKTGVRGWRVGGLRVWGLRVCGSVLGAGGFGVDALGLGVGG